MIEVTSTDFQMHCSKMMKLAKEKSEEITITYRGTPEFVLKALNPKNKSAYGCMKGTSTQLGDIMESFDDIIWTGDEENIFGSKNNE